MRGAGPLIEQELRSLRAAEGWLSRHPRGQQHQQYGGMAATIWPSSEVGTAGVQAGVATAAWPDAAVAAVAAGASLKTVAGLVVSAAALMQRLGVPVSQEVAKAAQQMLVDGGWIATAAAPTVTEDVSVKVCSRSSSPVDTMGGWMSAGDSGVAGSTADDNTSGLAVAGGTDDWRTELALHAHIYSSLWNAITAMEKWSSAMGRWHRTVIVDMNTWLLTNEGMVAAQASSSASAAAAAGQGGAVPFGFANGSDEGGIQSSLRSSSFIPVPMVMDLDSMLKVGVEGGLSEALQHHLLWDPSQPPDLPKGVSAGRGWSPAGGGSPLGAEQQVKSRAALLPITGAAMIQSGPGSDSDDECEKLEPKGRALPPRLLVADSLRFSKGGASSTGSILAGASSPGSGSWVATPGAISIRGPSALRMMASMGLQGSAGWVEGPYAEHVEADEEDGEEGGGLGGTRAAESSSGFDSSEWNHPLIEDVNRALEESTAGAAAAAGASRRQGTTHYAWGSVAGGGAADLERTGKGAGGGGRSAGIRPHPPLSGRPDHDGSAARPWFSFAGEGTQEAAGQGQGKRVGASSPGA
jgi:hypothetical protein